VLPRSGSDLTVELLRHHIQPTDSVTVIGGGAVLERALIDRFGFTNLAVHDPPMGFIRDPAAVDACIASSRRIGSVCLPRGRAPQSESLAGAIIERGGLHGVGLCIVARCFRHRSDQACAVWPEGRPRRHLPADAAARHAFPANLIESLR